MRHEPVSIPPVSGIDWKGLGYLVSICSVFLLGAIAWPKPQDPRWHVAVLIAGAATESLRAQAPPDHPVITVRGQTYTPRSILARNMGSPDDQNTAFPPHKVIGNIYYVGTRTLTSYLVTTPQGAILVNTTYERNVPVIQKSVEQLGFKFSDIKIILGTHAHGDHQEGDALVKQLTGAQVMAMAEDVPALQALKPGGKALADCFSLSLPFSSS